MAAGLQPEPSGAALIGRDLAGANTGSRSTGDRSNDEPGDAQGQRNDVNGLSCKFSRDSGEAQELLERRSQLAGDPVPHCR